MTITQTTSSAISNLIVVTPMCKHKAHEFLDLSQTQPVCV